MAGWQGYGDWLKKVQGSGQYWSDWDLQRAANDKDWADRAYEYKTGWYDARANDDKEGQAKYHDLMENLRSGTQYSGGAEGNEYHPWGSGSAERPSWDTDGSITAALDTARAAVSNWQPYSSPYAGRIEAALGRVENYGPYQNPYADRIENALSGMENYGPYVSPYQQQIDAQLQGIVGYGPYQSEYADRINDALSAIEGRGPFSYDLETDPAWQAYRKQYTREGRRATEDTLGQMAAMTGGMPSTAAMTAASQAGDYYNAQMTDKIPELYRLAYDMYLSEGDRMRQNLNDLRGLDSDAYGRYADTYNRMLSGLNALQGQDAVQYGRYGDRYTQLEHNLSALNNQDATAYGRYADTFNRNLAALDALNTQDAVAYGRYGDDYNRAVDAYGLDRQAYNDAYGRFRDTVGDWENDRNYADSRADAAWERDYQERAYADSREDAAQKTAWNNALTAAEYGDYSQLEALGVDTSRYQSDAQYKQDLDRAMTALEIGDTGPMAALGFNMSNYGDKLYAYGNGEKPYEIGSKAGQDFILNAPAGATITGGDGSTWTKSADGTTVTITKDGKTWTVSTGLALSGGRGYGGRGKGDDEDEDETGNEPTVDMTSVEALGYGPISAERLSNLVDSGEVEKYLENGQWKFRKRGTVYTQPLFTDWFKQKFGN